MARCVGGGGLKMLTNMLLIRGYVDKQPFGQYCMGTVASSIDGDLDNWNVGGRRSEMARAALVPSTPTANIHDSICWVPHPRTGIYIPEGQEKVMADVPDGAASLAQTYWLRNDPDHHGLDV